MPIKGEFKYVRHGNTVPYPAEWGLGRTNAGFINLRRDPSLVSEILEARRSPALRRLLRGIAESLDWMSFGCDLGDHIEPGEGARRHVAGGYVQFATTHLPVEPVFYETIGARLFRSLEAEAREADHWEMRFEIAPVRYEPAGLSVEIASLWVWFFAAAPRLSLAKASRETILQSIHNSLVDSVPE